VAYERSAWTDERLDDLAATLETSISQTRDELRDEIHALRDEMQAGFTALRQDLSAVQRQIAHIGWALAGTLAAALVALIVSLG
jgi:gas vesicle protein